jgi:hypothetical protein
MNTQHQTPEPSSTTPPLILKPKPRKHRRNGNIARLPKLERDLVNQMLSDGATYPNIVEALDEVGRTVTARNVSNWARGGYLDWLKDQEQVLENRARQDSLVDLLREQDASQLPEVGLQFAATTLSELLVKPGNLEADLDKYLRVIRTLCRLSREIFRLQKYRDDCARSVRESPEAIKKEDREFFASVREDYGPNSKVHLDPQMKDRDPEPAAQPGSTPASGASPAAQTCHAEVGRSQESEAAAPESSYIILQPDGSRKFSGIAYLQSLMEAEKASRESKPTPTSPAVPIPPKPVDSPPS